MSDEGRWKRLRQVSAIPSFAQLDHRLFMDGNGNDSRLNHLTRAERRKLKKETSEIVKKYRTLMSALISSGAGYPIDQLIRQFAFEYNNRLASSGTKTQPTSFNYMEPFLSLHIFPKSVAPYLEVRSEIDHLFFLPDLLDFVTDPSVIFPGMAETYKDIPEGKIFNYTVNGKLLDNIYLSSNSADYVVSGFSLIRHGDFLSWVLIGGQVLSEDQWNELGRDDSEPEILDPLKRKFLEDSLRINGSGTGLPLPLEGTDRAIRKILMGEFDLTTEKHTNRCILDEYERAFLVSSDDPYSLQDITDKARRRTIEEGNMDRLEQAAPLWSLADALLRIPLYFERKYEVVRTQKSPRASRHTPRGINTDLPSGGFKYVSSIEYVPTKNKLPIVSYAPTEFLVETDGYWKKIEKNSIGRGRNGEPVIGRNWVDAELMWRHRPDPHRMIYIKSSLEDARIQVAVLNAVALQPVVETEPPPQNIPCVYVLRCAAMQSEIYKVGWTTGTAEERARELSSATGVPLSFLVVSSWQHANAREVEAGVHALLAPYRLANNREFFESDFASIKSIVEAEIRRLTR